MIKVAPKYLLDGGGGHHKASPQELEREALKLITVVHSPIDGYVAVCERLGEKKYTVEDQYQQRKTIVEKVGDLVTLKLSGLRVIMNNDDVDQDEREAYLKELNLFVFGDKKKRKK